MTAKYHVALSFAGEDRTYVEEVAKSLDEQGVEVFYDRFEEADLWGKDLYTHLSKVYQEMALFTVMFVSDSYRTKIWTNHERKSAQARAISESQEYILPAFFDDTIEVPGLLKTVGHVSLKRKTPGQLADLIVEKLRKSGVKLVQQFGYSDSAKADIDFPLPKIKIVSAIINDLKSYTWGTQNPAVIRLLALDWSAITADEAFVLGRNLYQTACGGERKAEAVLSNLRRELAAIPEDRALDLLNGMFFEVYFDSAGEFRGRKLKSRRLGDLLSLQTAKKYAPSIAFIRRSLEPYRGSLLFLPNTTPEVLSVKVSVRKTDPPTVSSLKVGARNLIVSDPEESELSTRIWRLSFQSFTLRSLREQIVEEWGVPDDQLDISCNPEIDAKAKLRLPEGTSIVFPIRDVER